MPYSLSVQKFLPKSIVENFFSAFKPRFGEYVESRKLETIKAEIVLKLFIVSSFIRRDDGSLYCLRK